MGNEAPHKVPLNPSAKHTIVINYCGYPGFYVNAVDTALMIEDLYPETFRFEFLRDEGMSGRLEVTAFFDTHETDGRGHRIHSKASGDGLPTKNWNFQNKLE